MLQATRERTDRDKASFRSVTAAKEYPASLRGVMTPTSGSQSQSPNASSIWPTPPMGLNTWNSYHAALSERLIRQTIDDFESMGLAKLGY